MISLFGGNYGTVVAAATTTAGRKSTAPLEEMGATGTPNFSGYLSDAGEYNPLLSGLAAFSTYERMRRSDGMVAAVLMALKLPIRSAKWTVVEPADATPVEKEATDFIRQELIENIELDAVIENALLMLDFGCAAHEDVYRIDGNRIRIDKLAARMPLTFARWIIDEHENLVAVEQQGWRGDQYVQTAVPAENLALFTFGQEGANFAGRSVLRPMYKHWFMKDRLYTTDAIACERNGMGVPVITMGEGAKTEDIALANRTVQQLAVHEKAGAVLPPGWKLELVGVTGTLRDPKDSIAHHNTQIAMAGLAQFMVLGQSESGNRALGETQLDFFGMAEQAVAGKVARVINWSTVARLVDLNFAGVTRYPALVPQQVLGLTFREVLLALEKLGQAGFVAGDPGTEKFLRAELGLPEKQAATARQAPAAAPAAAAAGDEAGGADGDAVAAADAKMRREPRGIERCLAASEIVSALDAGRDEIAAALRAAKRRIVAEVSAKLVQTPVRKLHRVSIAPDEKLVAAVEQILRGLAEFGTQQVAEERARQKAGSAAPDAQTIRAAVKARRDQVGLYADAVVSEYQNVLTARTANLASDYLRKPGSATKGEILGSIESDLDEQSDKWIDAVASKGANEAFADGREGGYEEYKDEVGSVIYSALLDINTCEACADADGAEGATPDDIPDVPNPDCDGGDKCRCVHVYVFADEGKAVA